MIEVGKEILLKEAEALKLASDRINESFTKAVELLNSTDMIFISGVGKSGYIARKIVATINSYGIPSVFLDTVEALHGDLGIIKENATIILLSKSGTTKELIDLIPYLKSRNCKIIGVYGNQNSYLASNSDINIDASVDSEACPINLAPTSSTTLSLAIGDALAGALVKVKGIKPRDFAINHPSGQLGRNTNLKVKNVMKSGNDLPIITSNKSLKDAIIVISKKSLGCVCVIDSNNKLLGLITDGDIRRVLGEELNINNVSIEDIMTKDPVTIKEESFLGLALDLMENRPSQISILPVIDESKNLKGVIRIHDVYGN